MRVTQLQVYPVKSMAGMPVTSVAVQPWGLAGDRRYAVVDADGEKVTAREAPALLGLTATVLSGPSGASGADGILLADRDGHALEVAAPREAEPTRVAHSRQGTALPCGEEASSWLSARLGRPVRLVWQPDPRARPVSLDLGGQPGDTLSLADAGPLLLTTEPSLTQLNAWIADTDPASATMTHERFRPNVVIDGPGLAPFAEDRWPEVTIGDVRYRHTMICDRCVMTTIDPVTLSKGREPIRTLAAHRKWDGATWFGVRLVPLTRGSISIGDRVSPHG